MQNTDFDELENIEITENTDVACPRLVTLLLYLKSELTFLSMQRHHEKTAVVQKKICKISTTTKRRQLCKKNKRQNKEKRKQLCKKQN